MGDDDRPIVRPERSFAASPAAVLAVAVVIGLAAFYFYYVLQLREAPRPLASGTPQTVAEPAAKPSPPPAIRHPLEPLPAETPRLLPRLEESDWFLRDALTGLMGARPFAQYVIPREIVRRIVATVDNLPRPTAPRRVMPLDAVPGAFLASDEAIDPKNFARYTPYVRVLESVDAHALAQSYARAYPLFQRAYEELGYPGKYFNDRLIEAIDDMLAAPQLDTPARVMRPRILYEFADPGLEARSAGQKVLLRMGRDNALRVKAKLREIRGELTARGGRRG